MLDQEVHERLKQAGANVSLPDVTRELAGIDQEFIAEEEQSRLTYEVWDKVSPINDASAERMLAREDVDSSAEIYLLRDARTGKVIYFQPHKPKVSGLQRMITADCLTCAKGHKGELCGERAKQRITNEVAKRLGENNG